MTCPECAKEVNELTYPEKLVDYQCFACGNILTQEEITQLTNSQENSENK